MNACFRILSVWTILFLSACNSATSGTPQALPRHLPSPAAQPPALPWVACADQDPPVDPTLAGTPALPGGVWGGTYTSDAEQVTFPAEAMITEDGRFRLLSFYPSAVAIADPVRAVLVGDMTRLGNTFVSAASAYAEPGSSWSGNGYTEDLVITGVVASREHIAGDWSSAAGETGCFQLTYDALSYEMAPALAELQKTWSSLSPWMPSTVVNIDADGSLRGQSESGCGLVGSLERADADFGLYETSLTITSCSLAGTYTGVAYLCPCGIPEWYLIVAIDDGHRALRWAFD